MKINKKYKFYYLGKRISIKDKLIDIFIYFDEDFKEKHKLLFEIQKKQNHFFGDIIYIKKDKGGLFSSFSSIEKNDLKKEILDKYRLIHAKSLKEFTEHKEKEKIRKEKLKFEKENISLNNFTIKQFKKLIENQEYSYFTIIDLLEKELKPKFYK